MTWTPRRFLAVLIVGSCGLLAGLFGVDTAGPARIDVELWFGICIGMAFSWGIWAVGAKDG